MKYLKKATITNLIISIIYYIITVILFAIVGANSKLVWILLMLSSLMHTMSSLLSLGWYKQYITDISYVARDASSREPHEQIPIDEF